jgi:hypothetical protein
MTRIQAIAAVMVALGVNATAAQAKNPVADLQDLVGARGSSLDPAMQRRGYSFVGVTGPTSPTYWRKGADDDCVAVRTRDGRVRALDHAPAADCDKAAAWKPAPPKPTKSGYATVCGVEVDGKTYRYRCTLEGAATGAAGKTVLHFPDNRVALEWPGGNRVRATFDGMVPLETTYETRDGVTRFLVTGKPYFYVSDRKKAASELKTFQDK